MAAADSRIRSRRAWPRRTADRAVRCYARAAMPDASPLPAISRSSISSQQAVLIALRRIGPASPDALAAELAVTRSAALARLRALEAVGLVVRDVERHGVGRPRHRYDLTDDAQSLLPSNYASLATGLLEAMQAVADPSLVAAVFAERRRRQASAHPQPVRRARPRSGTAARPRPRAGCHPGRAGLPVRVRRRPAVRGSRPTAPSACGRRTAPSTRWRETIRRPVPPSWISSARCSVPRSCARRTSRPGTGPAPIASRPRRRARLLRARPAARRAAGACGSGRSLTPATKDAWRAHSADCSCSSGRQDAQPPERSSSSSRM